MPVLGHIGPKSSTPATGSGEETTEARLQRLPTTPRADSSTGIPWNVCVTRVPGERQAVLYKRGDRSYVWEITTKIVANLLDTHHAHGITNQRNEIEMLHILGELHGGMKCMNQTTLNINNWRHNLHDLHYCFIMSVSKHGTLSREYTIKHTYRYSGGVTQPVSNLPVIFLSCYKTQKR